MENSVEFNSDLKLSVAIGGLYKELLEAGYNVEQSTDAKEFKDLCKGRNERPISPHSDEIYFDFTEGTSFFLIARDENNDAVGTLATRKDSLGRTRLDELFERQYKRIFGGEQSNRYAPASRSIEGEVVYQGDFWINKRHRAKSLTFLLPKLALLLALQKFEPDYVYALIAPRIVTNGLHVKAGFAYAQPRAIDWEQAPDGLSNLYLVYSDDENLRYLAVNEFYRIHSKFAA